MSCDGSCTDPEACEVHRTEYCIGGEIRLRCPSTAADLGRCVLHEGHDGACELKVKASDLLRIVNECPIGVPHTHSPSGELCPSGQLPNRARTIPAEHVEYDSAGYPHRVPPLPPLDEAWANAHRSRPTDGDATPEPTRAIARPCPMTLVPSASMVSACVLEEGHASPCRFRVKRYEVRQFGDGLTLEAAGELVERVVESDDAGALLLDRADAHTIAETILRMVDNPLDAHGWAENVEIAVLAALTRVRRSR